jgi:hypothetical protein
MKYKIEPYLHWRKWVVPRSLREKPVHRWFVFPHSFTDDIVKTLIAEWSLSSNDLLIDNFCGAGTTVLAAKECNVPAKGFDLSPLAVLTANVKTANYQLDHLTSKWNQLRRTLRICDSNGEIDNYPDLIIKALPGKKLATFHHIRQRIAELDCSEAEKSFFLLSLVSLIPQFSNAVATGGWLSWEPKRISANLIKQSVIKKIESMLSDLTAIKLPRRSLWHSSIADARQLPLSNGECSAVITSPPYPNRHDYTRVFGVELMFGFLNWEQTRTLRYQMIESHPEANPARPSWEKYKEPRNISLSLCRLSKKEQRERIVTMLRGYFIDLYLILKEISRILKPKGKASLVLGNAQYCGIPFEADIATAEIGEQCGLHCDGIRLVRERGNSAQQMKLFGRNPSRESVIIFTKI